MSTTPQRASAHPRRASRLARAAMLLDLAQAVGIMTIAGITVAVVASLFAGLAFGAERATPAPLRLEQVRGAGLMFRGEAPDRFLAAPEVATDVAIRVTGVIARVRVRQLFYNPTDGWLEGIYLFPLPERAAVDRLRMVIGRRLVEGRIEERRAAERIYAEAKAAGRKAALLSSERPNIFTTAVANIGPGESVLIDIEYQQRVAFRSGEFRLRFPMVVGPRYVPPPGAVARAVARALSLVHDGGEEDWTTEAIRDAQAITAPVLPPEHGPANPLTLTVRLDPGLPLAELRSHHHPITRHEGPNHAVRLELAEGPVPADRDFELTWRLAVQEARAAMFLERGASSNYLMVMLAPPRAAELSERSGPREVIHVVDTSGSMGGTSIRQAKAALLRALDELGPGDRFNIIRFASDTSALYPAPRNVTRRRLDEARAYVEGLEAGGGTNMAPALRRALDAAGSSGDSGGDALRQVVFVTDGAVGDEAGLFRLIRNRLGSSRLFTVAIGSAPNSHFMREAARAGRGSFTHIGDAAQIEGRMAELLAKLSMPVLTDLEARFDGPEPAEVWPAPIPDLYVGEPVVFLARIDPASASVRVLGRLDGEIWEATESLHRAIPGSGIAKLWAREKIAGLESRRLDGEDAERLRQEIVALGLEHELVTRHTALVAVETTPSRPSGAPLASAEVPLNLPAGWVYDKVFGTGAPAALRQQAMLPSVDPGRRQALARLATTRPPPMTPPLAGPAGPLRAVALPRTATAAEWHRVLGALLVLSALLLAAGWGRWARD